MVRTRPATHTILDAGLDLEDLSNTRTRGDGALTSEEKEHMKATYRVLAYLIPVIVALQASFIALGVFGLGKWVEDGNDFTKSVLENGGSTGDVGFALHSFGARAAALVGLLLLIVSFFA